MANQTILHLNFVSEGDIDAPVVKKVIVRLNKNIHIKRVVGGSDVVTEYNFRNSPPTGDSVSRPDYTDSIYQYQIDADGDVHVWIAVVVPSGTDVPENVIKTASVMASIWKLSSETWTLDPVSGTQPDWIPGALTDEQKKAKVVDALKRWRQQVKTWLLESPQYADLVPEIVKHLGWWLSAADYVLKDLWDKKVAGTNTYDWLVLERVVEEAIKGPTTLDPDGDGSYNVEFFRELKAVIASNPNGPPRAGIWVNWWELTGSSNVGNVARKHMVNDVFAASTLATRTVAWTTAPPPGINLANYDPTVEYWTS